MFYTAEPIMRIPYNGGLLELVGKGYVNVEWRFSTQDLACIMPTYKSVDPAHAERLFPSSTCYRHSGCRATDPPEIIGR
jgi:hypothetical protein